MRRPPGGPEGMKDESDLSKFDFGRVCGGAREAAKNVRKTPLVDDPTGVPATNQPPFHKAPTHSDALHRRHLRTCTSFPVALFRSQFLSSKGATILVSRHSYHGIVLTTVSVPGKHHCTRGHSYTEPHILRSNELTCRRGPPRTSFCFVGIHSCYHGDAEPLRR
jgi:hypothetical protein